VEIFAETSDAFRAKRSAKVSSPGPAQRQTSRRMRSPARSFVRTLACNTCNQGRRSPFPRGTRITGSRARLVWEDVLGPDFAYPNGVPAGYTRLHALNSCGSDPERVRWTIDVPSAAPGDGYSIGAGSCTCPGTTAMWSRLPTRRCGWPRGTSAHSNSSTRPTDDRPGPLFAVRWVSNWYRCRKYSPVWPRRMAQTHPACAMNPRSRMAGCTWERAVAMFTHCAQIGEASMPMFAIKCRA